MNRRFFSSFRSLLLALIAAIIVTIAACGDDETEGTPTGGSPAQGVKFDGTLKIGFLEDLSGPGGATATTLSHEVAGKSAMEDINAKGGVMVGGKRYKLEQKVIDTRADPTATVAGANQLLSEQNLVAVYIGSLHADQAYQQLKTRVLSYAASPAVTYHIDSPVPIPGEGAQNNPLLFSNIDGFTPIVAAHLKMATLAFPEIKTTAMLASDAPLGRNLTRATEVTSQQLGLQFVGAEFAPLGTQDLTIQATNLKTKGPDFIFYATQPSILDGLNAALEVGAGKYHGVWTLRPVEIKNQLRSLGRSALVSPDWRLPFHKNLVPPEYRSAVDKLGELPGGEPRHTGWAISQWDFIHLLAQAIEKADTVSDARAIAQALIGQTYDGPFGKTTVLENQTSRGTIGQITKQGDTYTVWGWESIDAVLQGKPPIIKFSAPASQVEP
ncbi:MAG TPA: ABC transporter substrate-binding protein [Dehalococcoidia bacterium]|nr:ABC transporter substrate-binding protein [Dehalococcoidia bacterium]